MASVQLNTGSGGPLIAANSVTRDGVTEYMELTNIADPNSAACAPVDAVNGLAVQVKTLPGSPAQDGVDGTGISPPAGGSGIRGFLSGIYQKLSNTLTVAISGTASVQLAAGTNKVGTVVLDGCTYLNINDNATHTASAAALVGVQNLSGTAQTVSLSVWDNTTASGPLLTGPLTLGAEQIITFPLGGIKATSGSITAQLSAGAINGSGVQLLYR